MQCLLDSCEEFNYLTLSSTICIATCCILRMHLSHNLHRMNDISIVVATATCAGQLYIPLAFSVNWCRLAW